MSDTLTEARRATPQKQLQPNRTPQIEPRWFKPLENDSILIFFCFTRTTSWTRRCDPACCCRIVYSVRFDPHTGEHSDDTIIRIWVNIQTTRSFELFELFGIFFENQKNRNLLSFLGYKAPTHKKMEQWGSIKDLARLHQAYLLGLLAKIKCSICSYQLNLWYLLHGNKWD